MKSFFYKFGTMFTLAVTTLLIGAGCQKGDTLGDTPVAKTYNVQGVWVGTASNATITIPYYLTVKQDGTCTFEGITAGGLENFGTGTWTLSGTTFTCHLNTLYGVPANINVKQTVTGTFDSKAGTLTTLVWIDTLGGTDQGTFLLTRADDQIHGLWAGTASNATITIPYFMTVKPNGICTFEGITAGGLENFGTGTWTLNGAVFTAYLNTPYGVPGNINVKQTVTGTYDSKSGTVTSITWIDTMGGTDQGTFSLTKVSDVQ